MPQLIDQTNEPLPHLAPRKPDSHKGDYGRALLVGGSRGMSGAIALAGLATLRSGAGLVTLAVPRSIQDIVASFNPCYMTRALPDDGERVTANASNDALLLADQMTAIALGPGLGRAAAVTHFVERLYREVSQPMVVDADALFALAERNEAIANAAGPRILTPHPGEFARLTTALGATGFASAPSDDASRIQISSEFALACARPGDSAPIIVVLKGHHTVITDGTRFALNQTGNPGMATGGTGDTLTGIITALLCQGLAPFDAARLGVHLHGLAGDLATAKLGQVSLIASDIIDYLPAAFQSLP